MRNARDGQSEKQLKKRLKGVRKRKRTKQGFGCEVMASKMRLVQAHKAGGEQRGR
jgi:hypothetical protein